MNEDSSNVPPKVEPSHSPQSAVDSASLANCMVKNKESLKVKLMLRRPIDVLVDQGILPPPKSSPSFYEQKLKLERAKTGDFLKHKIQRRPQRDELIQQHILEESFDPSYYEQERKLKKARLADDLNERLSQRPGPLELIKGNILHTDECLEQAIKEGQITFKKTCEGEVIKNPPKRFVFEEESSSDSAPSPLQSIVTNSGGTTIFPNQATNISGYQLNNQFIITNGSGLISIPQKVVESPPLSVGQSTTNLLKPNLSYIVTTPQIFPSTTSTTVFFANDSDKRNCLNVVSALPTTNIISKSDPITPGPINQIALTSSSTAQSGPIQKSKKKIKSKSHPKPRIIKFHEYTGPPNVKKQPNSNQSHVETSYELLLQQQQLFLQWQLESQQKFPQMAGQAQQDIDPDSNMSSELQTVNEILTSNDNEMKSPKKEELTPVPSPMLSTNDINGNFQLNQSCFKSDDARSPIEKSNSVSFVDTSSLSSCNPTYVQSPLNQSKQYTPIVKKIISKLEDMKVSDLKAELKKRNLPVSGPKQQLIERLKPFSDTVVSNKNSIELNGATLINLSECNNSSQLATNQDLLKSGNISANFTVGSLSAANSTTFILKNNLNNNNDHTISTVPLQIKQPSPITLETPTLTIPITNTFIPQYQIVSTASPDKISLNGIDLSGSTTIQSPIANNILVNNKLNILNPQSSILSTSVNYNQANQIGKNSNLTILTGEPIQLGSIKNGLSFNLAQPVPNIANKIVSLPNTGPVFHQFLLYPTALNPPQDVSALNVQQSIVKQRSNSLPSESFHHLQRNTSLPLVINQVPVSQVSTGLSSGATSFPIKQNPITTISTTSQPFFTSISTQPIMINNTNELKHSNIFNNNLTKSSAKKDATFKIFKPTNQNQPEIIQHKFTNANVSTSTISSSNVDFGSGNNNMELKQLPVDSSVNHIQPDSTTNSSPIDLDFILNFDGLHDDGLGETMNDNSIVSQNESGEQMNLEMNLEGKQQKNSSMDVENKNNEIIDFSDQWFDMTFGQASSDAMMENDTTGVDNDFLETINQIFDPSYSDVASKNIDDNLNENHKSNCSQIDHTILPSSMNASNSTNIVASNSISYNSNQLCHFSANYPANSMKFNHLNASSNFSLDDFAFDDTEFRSSIDFPIILDKLDFAT